MGQSLAQSWHSEWSGLGRKQRRARRKRLGCAPWTPTPGALLTTQITNVKEPRSTSELGWEWLRDFPSFPLIVFLPGKLLNVITVALEGLVQLKTSGPRRNLVQLTGQEVKA